MTSRTPSSQVRRILREEVNYGCPVEDCGVPYLTWHHFDPPWREQEHHDPEGMIALCPIHAGHADGGRWTVNQLKDMKENPYISKDEISGKYDYLRRNVVSLAGSIAYDVQNIVEIDGERIIGFELDDEGYYRLNILVKNDDNEIILNMENNDWTVFRTDIFELICTAQGKELRIRSKDNGINFQMRFDNYSNDKFREMLKARFNGEANRRVAEQYLAGFEKRRGMPHPLREEILKSAARSSIEDNINLFLRRIGDPTIIPTWTLMGTVFHNQKKIRITHNTITDLVSNISFQGSFFLGCHSVIDLKDKNLIVCSKK